MEKQNIKEYILDLATECILHSENAYQPNPLIPVEDDMAFLFLNQAFYCAKKIQELYYFEYKNTSLRLFYTQFYNFNKTLVIHGVFSSNKKIKQEFERLKTIYLELKKELNEE